MVMNGHHHSLEPTILTIIDMKLNQTVISVQTLKSGIYILIRYHITSNKKYYLPYTIIRFHIDLWGYMEDVKVNDAYKYKYQ